jgi:hypothetical protein
MIHSKTPFVLRNREINAVFQVGFKHGRWKGTIGYSIWLGCSQ